MANADLESVVRPAAMSDVDELVAMRAELAFEGLDPAAAVADPGYDARCRAFLADAIQSDGWQIWVAERAGNLVANAFVALVDKVPSPAPDASRIAYLTNVYTRPAHRNHGVGSAVVRRAQEAARAADVELMIVWPSEESVTFYERAGFTRPDEPLIWHAAPWP